MEATSFTTLSCCYANPAYAQQQPLTSDILLC